jgi:signal transduction histidine kinase
VTTEGGDFLRFAAFHHREPEARALLAPLLESVVVRRDQGLFGRVIESGQALFFPIVAASAVASENVPGFEAYLSRYGIHSLIVAPLKIQERVIGGVGLSRSYPGDPYTEDDLELVLDLASRAALAIRNAQLFTRIQREAKDREEIMAIVAHDLRNPLGVVSAAGMLLTNMADADPQNSRLRTLAGRVTRAAERMDDLITNVLDASRIESGGIQVNPATVDVGSLLDKAVEALAPSAQEKGVNLERAPSTQPLACLCDEGRVLQVFSNLIGNAIRFTPKGGRVDVRAVADGAAVRFAIEDTGPGIAPEVLPRVFDRYFKRASTARSGTGLGLYIARGIIEAHGGRIWADSTPENGATFTFTLPLKPE